MGLGGAPPLLPLLPPELGNEETVPLVLAVIATKPAGLLSGSLEDVLIAPAGPGKIFSGTIADTSSSNTIKLITPQGAEITLARPPGLSLPSGSSVSLRTSAAGLTTQVQILTVNGRPASSALLQSTAPSTAGTQAAPTQPTLPQSDSRYIVSASDQAAALVTSALVDLSRGNLLAAPQFGPAGSATASALTQTPLDLTQTLVAILVRTAGVPRSGPLPAIGTRYRVAILSAEPPPEGEEPTAVATENEPAATATPASENATETQESASANNNLPASQVSESAKTLSESPSPLAEETQGIALSSTADVPAGPSLDDAAFVAQSAELSGRVVDVKTDNSEAPETLVETPLGTLSLPIADKALQPGATVQLKITHVAAPLARSSDRAPAAQELPAASSTLVEKLNQTVAAIAPALRQSALVHLQDQLLLNPGPQLAAEILEFLQPTRKGSQRRDIPEAAIKEALKATGASDLATDLFAAASSIGKTVPASNPNDWSITILPFIGTASVRPARLYRKEVQDADGKPQLNAHRFVLDVELKRLGPLQFDGLLQDRRFDLMLRARRPLEGELRSLIQRVFREAIGMGGFSGEIGFGGLLSLPADSHPQMNELHRVDA